MGTQDRPQLSFKALLIALLFSMFASLLAATAAPATAAECISRTQAHAPYHTGNSVAGSADFYVSGCGRQYASVYIDKKICLPGRISCYYPQANNLTERTKTPTGVWENGWRTAVATYVWKGEGWYRVNALGPTGWVRVEVYLR